MDSASLSGQPSGYFFDCQKTSGHPSSTRRREQLPQGEDGLCYIFLENSLECFYSVLF